MSVSKKRPRKLIERTRPQPRGLHRSWLAPAWERAQQHFRGWGDSLFEEENRGEPLLADIQTTQAITWGLPLDVVTRHHQLFARILHRAQHRLDIAVKRDEERKRKQPRRSAAT